MLSFEASAGSQTQDAEGRQGGAGVTRPAMLDAASTVQHHRNGNIVAAKEATVFAPPSEGDALDMFAYDDPFSLAQTNHPLYLSDMPAGP